MMGLGSRGLQGYIYISQVKPEGGGVREEQEHICSVGELTHQLDALKGRQAVNAALQAIQAELLETQLEELEIRLAQWKRTARRKAARKSSILHAGK